MKRSKALTNLTLFLIIFLLPVLALADSDPFTSAGNKFMNILFGTLGMSLCTISLGVTFIMAKFGKISWDKFLFVGFCIAGFIGAPSIIEIIRNVSGG